MRLKQFLKIDKYDLGLNLFGWEVLSLLATMTVGLSIEYSHCTFTGLGSWQAILTGSMMAFSMGVHNAASQELITNCPSTTVMTMTIVKTSMYAANAFQYLLATKALSILYAKHELKPHNYDAVLQENYETNVTKFTEFGMHLCVFIAGAIIGAVLAKHISYWCIFMPIAVVLGIIGLLLHGRREQNISKQREAITSVDIEVTAMTNEFSSTEM